jgi:hypothetical protein
MMALKARLLGIIGAEFVAEELAACVAPRLQFTVHDRQQFDAKRTTGCGIGILMVCAHKTSPGMSCVREPVAYFILCESKIAQSADGDCCANDTRQ